ncbi:hypothetical protein [Micromonospora sp. NPDC051141]|uniref:hypothetical protein n=1 Tax=Micromonospora sp. NPDC051141 TaxID=3364284 RepID=UPI0037AFFB09
MTQRPDRAVWPTSTEDVPATAPGRAPALAPVHHTPPRPPDTTDEPTLVAQKHHHPAPGTATNGRRRFLRAAALTITALLAGGAIGVAASHRAIPPARSTPTANDAAPPAGALFAHRQAAINRAALSTSDLAAFASPWLGGIGNCVRDQLSEAERGNGETTRSHCGAGIVTSYWITYRTLADRDAAQARYQSQAANTSAIAAGATPPTQRNTLTGQQVQYVEYAYRIPAGAQAGQIVVAIWWSDPTKPIAGVLTCYWTQLGSSWAPLRDLWAAGAPPPAQR